jgi:hypothetical protein
VIVDVVLRTPSLLTPAAALPEAGPADTTAIKLRKTGRQSREIKP